MKTREMARGQAFRSAKVGGYFSIAFPKSKLKFNSSHCQGMGYYNAHYYKSRVDYVSI